MKRNSQSNENHRLEILRRIAAFVSGFLFMAVVSSMLEGNTDLVTELMPVDLEFTFLILIATTFVLTKRNQANYIGEITFGGLILSVGLRITLSNDMPTLQTLIEPFNINQSLLGVVLMIIGFFEFCIGMFRLYKVR